MDATALAGIVALLLIKEAGVPIPVPGDLVVIAAGATVAASGPPAAIALLAILAAGFAGGTLQFLLLRGRIRRGLLALLARLGVPEARIEPLAARLRGRGSLGVAVSRMTPGIRIVSIAASALAAIPMAAFVRGLMLGNTVFVGAHFGLGIVLGASASALVARGSGIIVPLLIVVVALAVVGALGWAQLGRRRLRRGAAQAASWADACCPACLTLAVVADGHVAPPENR